MPFSKKKRVERWQAEVDARKERSRVITDEQLRQLAKQPGYRVEWKRYGVIVREPLPSGTYATYSYPALGNGRYQTS